MAAVASGEPAPDARLEERATLSSSPAARRGARETQMVLGIIPMAYIPDEDET